VCLAVLSFNRQRPASFTSMLVSPLLHVFWLHYTVNEWNDAPLLLKADQFSKIITNSRTRTQRSVMHDNDQYRHYHLVSVMLVIILNYIVRLLSMNH
jgi:hypothetical protein